MTEKIEHKYRALPHAGINPGGDCGPACIAGIMGTTVEEVYNLLGKKVDGLCYDWVTKFLFRNKIYYENHLPSDQFIDENPQWFSFGRPSWWNFIEWYELSKRRMRAGLVGLAQVNMNGNAHNDDCVDHWVIIYGFEQISKNAVDKLLLISCPTKGEYKVDAKTFLRRYGGYNTIWCEGF